MIFKRTRSVMINQIHFLFPWCHTITGCGNNLYNAVRFRQRNVMTARTKKPSELTVNEQEVVNEIKNTMGIDVQTNKKKLSNDFLYHLMQDSKNPDYYAKGLPRQSAQQTIKQAVIDMDSYWKALAAWKREPSAFTGKPELPGYRTKGGHSTVAVTNQDCPIRLDKNGVSWAYLPYAKKLPLCIGMPEGVLKQVNVVPVNGAYRIDFIFDVEVPDTTPVENPARIAAIDFGVDNLMAVTNNIGAECLLYKGGIVKSVNRLYNKKLADIMSEEMTKPGCPKNKAGAPKFVPTPESKALTNERNNRIHDFMQKTAVHFIAWCVENRIDTIVMGVNKGWKQESNMGAQNNQNFVQIPFSYLQWAIEYRAEEHGINVVKQEESYTSRASFLDNDFIPVYKEGDTTKYTFSGKRGPTRYGNAYKKNGFRGLYRAKDGTIINSDLNGSANILRKAFPDAFNDANRPNFKKVTIITNPELEFVVANQQKQASLSRPLFSKSKKERLIKRVKKVS